MGPPGREERVCRTGSVNQYIREGATSFLLKNGAKLVESADEGVDEL